MGLLTPEQEEFPALYPGQVGFYKRYFDLKI